MAARRKKDNGTDLTFPELRPARNSISQNARLTQTLFHEPFFNQVTIWKLALLAACD